MFCDNFLSVTIPVSSTSSSSPSYQVNIIRLLIGLLYLIMMNVTIIWITIQKRKVLQNNSQTLAIESIIFPLFINIMWILALSDCYIGLLIIFLPINLYDHHHQISLAQFLLYPLGYIVQHAVIEGIAFLLLQKGCGYYGSRKAGQLTFFWTLFTTIIMYIRFAQIPIFSNLCYLLWCFILVIFYLLIWMLPSKYLYRRSAVIPYAKFWFIYRSIMLIFLLIITFRSIISELVESIGICGYDFVYLLFYPLIHPIVLYRTLLNDSRWWQGIAFHLNDSRTNGNIKGTMRAPLLGVDLSQHSAQLLARVVDDMGGKQSANLLNFAEIHLDKHKMLGHGSFSKVYRGTYRSTPCAIKLIFTADLTEDVILRAEAEAILLSSVKSPNIVKIIGVSVLPPSVCLVLELCAYGSLSDVIRGDGGALRKLPLSLSSNDRLYLALGCARGVAALHSLGRDVVHRDIKSYNFLVDGQLNAKLADLELGSDSRLEVTEDDSPFQKDFLANWAPPEVLRGDYYTQASDIYSLSLVLWEIMSGKIPFLDSPTPPTPPPLPPLSNPLPTSAQQQSSTPILATLSKNFSFQSLASLTGYDSAHHSTQTGNTHHGHGHSRQSIDSKKVSSRVSTRNQVLSGYRPDIPPCPPEYAEMIRRGWSVDRYHRPSATDLVTELERILVRSLPTNLNVIEESTDVSQMVDNFLSSKRGNDYLTEIGNFRNQGDDSTIRFSLFTQTSKLLPSFNFFFPNFNLDSKLVQSPPARTLLDEGRSTPNLGMTGSTPLASELMESDENLASSKDKKTSGLLPHESSLSSLYIHVNESAIWSLVNGLTEPVLILTGQSPFFILKGSVNWHSLMGYTSEEIFGRCLEHFIPSDYLFTSPFVNQVAVSQPRDSELNSNSNNEDEEVTTYDTLISFYRQLQFHSTSKQSEINYHHILLKLQSSDQRVLPFSIHALPLYKRQERRFGSDSVSGISSNLRSIIAEGSPCEGTGLGEAVNSQHNDELNKSDTVAYYVLYMNHLTYLYPEDYENGDNNSNELDKERSQSIVDRMMSIASSTISGVGKSWMNSNSNAVGRNSDMSNQNLIPPAQIGINSESGEDDEKWGGYLL